MRKLMIFSAVIWFLTSLAAPGVQAGEVDILIKKLVEKGILTQSDASQLLTEIQKESAQKEKEVKQVVTEAATDAAKKEAKSTESKIPKWVQNTSVLFHSVVSL